MLVSLLIGVRAPVVLSREEEGEVPRVNPRPLATDDKKPERTFVGAGDGVEAGGGTEDAPTDEDRTDEKLMSSSEE